MGTLRLLTHNRFLKAAIIASLAWGVVATSSISRAETEKPKAETLRPEVGQPLVAAQALIKEKKFQEALAKVREADAVADKTPYEIFISNHMRGAAASGAGDSALTVSSFEAVINSGRLPVAEQIPIMESILEVLYRTKNYANVIPWGERYFKSGGANSQVRTLVMQARFLNGDFVGAAKDLTDELSADSKAGKTPTEDKLQLLATCYVKVKDFVGYAEALERMVTFYPKKEYWADLIARIQRKTGFAERLELDAYRLMAATGNLVEPSDYADMAQFAIKAGLPAEAQRVINEGFTKNILGSGKDADAHKRLRTLANKQAAEDLKSLPQSESQAAAAKDGNILLGLGHAYVTNEQIEKGIRLMEQGIAKGGLKRPEDAKLHLGLAYLKSGDKAKAMDILKTVQGSDGTADLARLWIIQAK